MSKYTPLTEFLATQRTQEVPLTFRDIEKIIGCPLPKSKQYPAWWSNNPSNNVMTPAWLAAGFKTERVDVASERLVFRRDGRTPTLGGSGSSGAPLAGFFEGVRARLGGTVRIAPDVDITEPTGVVWDAQK